MRMERSKYASASGNIPEHGSKTGSTFGLFISEMPDLPREIVDRQGYRIDLAKPRWSAFGADQNIRIDQITITNAIIRRAVELFIVHKLCYGAPQTARNTFSRLMKLSLSPSFRRAEISGKVIPSSIVREVGEAMKVSGSPNYMSYEADIRYWYIWCADMGFPYFDPEIATELEALVIGGNAKGLAILSNDPNTGPLSQADFSALCVRLKNEENSDTPVLSLFELCLIWLFIALGSNPKNLAYLCESDFSRHIDAESGSVLYTLMVPRIKKRGKGLRREFKERKLHPALGKLVEQLIELNACRRDAFTEWQIGNASLLKPIFLRERPKTKWVDTDAERYAWFHDPHELSRVVTNAISKLDVPTALDPGTHIRCTPRRLRYTFATRLVQEGASHQAVAEALDHSDLQHVMVYFNVRNEMVNFLDRANPRLIAVAQAFAGTLISDESQAERGDDPKSRILPPPATRKLKPLGNCGSFTFCNEAAPIACYTCMYFRPWKDAPHHIVFEFLMDQRQRKIDADAEVKNIQIHDLTIRAVAHVMELCGGADTHEAT